MGTACSHDTIAGAAKAIHMLHMGPMSDVLMCNTSCKPITDKLCQIFWVGIGEKFGSLPSNLKMEAVCSHDTIAGAAEAIHML
jgi:hypothetical protein